LLLATFVRRGDEVRAAVLGELDRTAQRLRRHRDQQFLGPGVDDLDAEAAAHVGGDDVDLTEVEAELGGDGGTDAGGGLGGRPHAHAVEVLVPPGDGAAALHRHAGTALDGEV